MSRVLLGIIAALGVGCGGLFLWVQERGEEIDRLEGALRSHKLLLGTCNARVSNLLEDKESDDAVDEIPDDGLAGSVPDRWLLPTPGAAGGGAD